MISAMNAKRKYLAFGIETARITEDGSDWRSCRPLGISCAGNFVRSPVSA